MRRCKPGGIPAPSSTVSSSLARQERRPSYLAPQLGAMDRQMEWGRRWAQRTIEMRAVERALAQLERDANPVAWRERVMAVWRRLVRTALSRERERWMTSLRGWRRWMAEYGYARPVEGLPSGSEQSLTSGGLIVPASHATSSSSHLPPIAVEAVETAEARVSERVIFDESLAAALDAAIALGVPADSDGESV